MISIGIGVLSWNGLEDSKLLLKSICNEQNRIDQNEFPIYTLWVDNGSTDGTQEFLKKHHEENEEDFWFWKNDQNEGIAKGKNIYIDVLKNVNKYMFMFDNDVSVIPGSLQPMIEYMEQHPEVGCFGHHIDFYSKDPDFVPEPFPSVEQLNIQKGIKSGVGATRCWTHYSIFRTDLFKHGIKFDESGPFGEPGYPFDDDDLGMQITRMGYEIHCFTDIKCYHNINSSVEPLNKLGQLNYSRREKYFKSKWGDKLNV